MDNELSKQNRAISRNKYLRTDKSNKARIRYCCCLRCNPQLSKRLYNEKQLKKTIVAINKDHLACEFI